LTKSHAVLMPGGLRWRSLVPLEDRNGLCEVIYDLERNILVEVPDVFQYHIAMALETGTPDETLLGWLASEDLLTYERSHKPGTKGGGGLQVSELSELSHAFGCVYFVEDRAHVRLTDGSESAARETLDCLLGPLYRVTRVTIHLEGRGRRLSSDRLRRLVEVTRSRTEGGDREISYELRLDADAVTPDLASFLEQHPFRVRVRCDGPPDAESRPKAHQGLMRALTQLRDRLGSNLTVHALLQAGGPLRLWRWAREIGLHNLHVTRLSSRAEDGASREAELRAFRGELDEICEDMLEGLQTEGKRPLLYEPIVRVVRRLARTQPRIRTRGGPYMGVVSHGRVFPIFQGAGLAGPESSAGPPALRADLEGEEESGCGHLCHRCWARRLCGRGLAADPALTGRERLDVQGRHCDFWRSEVEAGVLFHRRLKEIDPEYLLGLAGNAGDAFVDPPDTAADYFEWRTC